MVDENPGLFPLNSAKQTFCEILFQTKRNYKMVRVTENCMAWGQNGQQVIHFFVKRVSENQPSIFTEVWLRFF